MPRSAVRSERLTLELPNGRALAVPLWMLEPVAAQYCIVSTPCIPLNILLTTIELVHKGCSASASDSNALEHHDGSIPP